MNKQMHEWKKEWMDAYSVSNFISWLFCLVSLPQIKQTGSDTLSFLRQWYMFFKDFKDLINKLPIFLPRSWVNKLKDINGIEKNYEIALCILKEGQRKSGTVDYKELTREILNRNFAFDWHFDNLTGVKCLVTMVYMAVTCACRTHVNFVNSDWLAVVSFDPHLR